MNLLELEHSTKKPILYVDMDGVLADFYGPFNKMAGVSSWKDASKDTVSQVLRDITKQKDFWINLDVLSDVPKLMSAIKTLFNGQYKILSKALAGDKRVMSQKKQWVQSNLAMQPNETIIMPATADKGMYAKQGDGTANILIDDFGYNIKKWQSAGGIGIQHTNGTVNNTIKQLQGAINK
tara:strand:- start:2603 stop:3142 length:540 start_codon:yes stop_codon:yes gene_type:complete